MPDPPDAHVIERVLGVKPEAFGDEGVVKASFPRKDVPVRIEGRPMEPFLGLTSWASFQKGKKPGVEAMMMGDLVLFEDEVNPAMSAALEHGIEVTALHNHFFFDQPKVYFMHIGGEGTLAGLATGTRSTLDAAIAVRSARPTPGTAFGPAAPRENAIEGKAIEEALGVAGQAKEGMFKVVIGREATAQCGCVVGKSMGVNTWAAFAGTMHDALVDGDFAVLEGELQGVLRRLRSHGINVVAIHNHMTFEQPRFIFLHYWGRGPTRELTTGLRAALEATRPRTAGRGACCEGH